MTLVEQIEYLLALLRDCQRALPDEERDLKARVSTFLADQKPAGPAQVRAYNLPKR